MVVIWVRASAGATPSRGGRRVEGERQPQLLAVREREALRHHADDGPRDAVRLHRPPQHVAGPAEPVAPQLIAEDDHRVPARPVLRFPEGPPEDGPHPQQLEDVVIEVPAGEPLGLAVAFREVDLGHVERPETLEDRLLIPEVREVLPVDRHEVDVARRVGAADDHHAVGPLEREPLEEHAVHDAEDRRGEPDAERERDDDGEREAGTLEQHPDAEAKVPEQCVHGRPASEWWPSRAADPLPPLRPRTRHGFVSGGIGERASRHLRIAARPAARLIPPGHH
jgi:hypothetical protein